MCRNIKPLFNFDPPTTRDEIRDASLQFVRKLSGYRTPSITNTPAFERAVAKIAADADELLQSLTTDAMPRNREAEAERARNRARKRFGNT